MTPAGAVAATPGPERVRFGRLEFTTGSRQVGRAILRDWLGQTERPKLLVGFINPHVYNGAGAHADVAEFLESCDFVCVDGIGVTFAAKLLDRTRLSRVVATDLFDDLVGGLGRSVDAVLVGATSTEVVAAADQLNKKSKELRVIDTMDGFSDAADYEAFFTKHREVDVVLVGAGSPKSEQLLLAAHRVCRSALSFHIGAGTIKLYSGTKRRAPKLVSRLGFEWMHRIIFEPHTRSRYVGGAWTFASDLLRSKRAGARS
ncbi:MAG: WecB/TagA/CpsF family glycosyltransferase [bacterium]|nr:WecB/TagA/CpsF family glycosyltransferase [bacterium]